MSSECLLELRGLKFGANFALSAAMKFAPTPPGPKQYVFCRDKNLFKLKIIAFKEG